VAPDHLETSQHTPPLTPETPPEKDLICNTPAQRSTDHGSKGEGMDLGTALTWTTERYPEHIGLVGLERRLTYPEWDARTNQIAHALLSLGASPGDRVVMLLSNTEVLASTHLAAQKIGVMSTPLNIRLSPTELSYCLRDADPTVLITDDAAIDIARRSLASFEGDPRRVHAGTSIEAGQLAFEDVVAEQPTTPPDLNVRDSDPSVMLYTSGTTGKPKGVPRTQRNEWAASVAHILQAGYVPGERTLGAMPMYHTMGLRSLLSMVLIGGTFVELPAVDADRALQLIEQEQITSLYLVPTAFWALHATGRLAAAARSVTKIGYAGAPMTSTLTEQLSEAIQPEVFINHYGSSEIYTFSIEARAAAKPGSAGRAGVFSRLRVVDPNDDDHEPLEPGETGEIVASLASEESFAGYWQRPDADERSLRKGWYHTGDLGIVDDDGDLWVSGRVDDMIITGGENVHPVEVEDVLARSSDIAEVAVIGIADEKWGQAVTAFVVPTDRGDPEVVEARILQWIRTEADMSSYKRPKQVVLVEEIPKSPVGKLLRRKLVAGDYQPLQAPDGPPDAADDRIER
jgi:2-furoate---CoA ligase